MKICKVVGLCVGIAALGGCADVEETRAREVVGAAIDAVQPPIAGWASQTGYRQASTLVQTTIVAAAQASAGGSSGDSFSVAPIGDKTPWLTDIADGDGARMRSAYKRYYDWRNNAAGESFTQVRTKMIGDLSTSAYDAPRKGLLVDRMVAIAGPPAAYGPFQPPPTTDQDTLSALGIRKQCLEWAVTMALQSGGKAKGYGASAVTDLATIRPGMGLYRSNHSHAMIIIDVEWSAAGVPLNYRVAESNWGSGWMNPAGMIPWQRTIGVGRVVPAGGPVHVVDYES